jgi:hypothetical protein
MDAIYQQKKRINITWYTHTMEYHSSGKRSEALKHSVIWMDSRSILLSEISQTKEYYIIPVI